MPQWEPPMPFNSEDDCQRIKNNYWKHLTESFVRSVKKSFVITEETSRICNRPYLRIICIHPAVS